MARKKKTVLLLEDLPGKKGRKGDIRAVSLGFWLNFLYPKNKAKVASPHLVELQKRLQNERQQQAEEDRKEAEELAAVLNGLEPLEIIRQSDTEGHLYGSVTSKDIEPLLKSYAIRKVMLDKPIKKVGSFKVPVLLKEQVKAVVQIEIKSESSSSDQQS